jgi:hypothetical protein
MMNIDDGEEFTFSADSPVDPEGYAVSEEERAGEGEAAGRPGSERREQGNSKRRRRS